MSWTVTEHLEAQINECIKQLRATKSEGHAKELEKALQMAKNAQRKVALPLHVAEGSE